MTEERLFPCPFCENKMMEYNITDHLHTHSEFVKDEFIVKYIERQAQPILVYTVPARLLGRNKDFTKHLNEHIGTKAIITTDKSKKLRLADEIRNYIKDRKEMIKKIQRESDNQHDFVECQGAMNELTFLSKKLEALANDTN